MKEPIKYSIVDDFDFVIDEARGGNTFIALRKIRWGDNEKVNLDLRKWFTGSDGSDIPGKGVSFINEDEGPSELINVLLQNNYGDTKSVLSNIKDREDFRPALNSVLGKEDELYDDSYDEEEEQICYDPKELLA